MLGSAVLDVAIGVVFIFLLVSTICTAVREGIEAWLRSRSVYLDYGIRELLHDRDGKGLVAALYAHPLVHGLFLGDYEPSAAINKVPILMHRRRELPSYIPARSFAIALMDIAARGDKTDVVSSDPSSPVMTVESVRANLLNLKNPQVQRVLLYALDTAKGDLDLARANIETWFDSGMERVSGWYKRSTQWIVFWIAVCVTVALNIDTIAIAEFLYTHEGARAALVERAKAATEEPAGEQDAADGKQAHAQLAALPLPIGWSAERVPESGPDWFGRVLGWLLTALAATLGSPFWFDVLNRFMVIRSTVKPNEKSREEASKDRQLHAAPEAPPAAPVAPVAGAGIVVAHVHVPHGVPASTLRDDDSAVDACDVEMDDETRDEDLPVATGGVA